MNGRPRDWAGRPEKEVRVYDLLDRLEVSYQRVDHEAAMTMEVCVPIGKDLLKEEAIDCHPCVNTSSLRLRTADLMQPLLPAMEHTSRRVTL